MLRAIRDRVDADGFYRQSLTTAADLAGVTIADAERTINELMTRGWLRVARPRRLS